MSAEQFANNATTTLGSALSSAATTAVVATGTGALFPAITGSQYFTATLWAAGNTTGVPNEIVKVTARSGDTMTIVRAQEGTSALNWNVGDTFANYPTAGFLDGVAMVIDIQQQEGNYGVDSGTANAGVVALTPGVLTLTPGLIVRVKKISTANTGAYTINVGVGGNITVVLPGGSALASGVLPASGVFTLVYDGAVFELQSVTPSASIPTSLPPNGPAGGQLSGTYPNPNLATSTVTNAELVTMAAHTVKMNNTGSTANPQDVSVTALWPNSALANMAANTVKMNNTGASTAPQDVSTTGLWANSELANMAATTVKANPTGGAAAPQDMTFAALAAALGVTFSGTAAFSAASGAVSVAHGLGVTPLGFQVRLHCLSADQGYSTGDEISLPSNGYSGGAGGSGSGGSAYVNATTIGYVYNEVSITPKGNGVPVNPTPGSWEFILVAWVI